MYIKNNEIKQKYVRLLHSICMIETPSASKESIDKMADTLQCFAEENGYTTERYTFEKAGDYLLIKLNETSNEEPVMLMAHMDTVHAEGAFGKDIVTISDNWMLGPGTMDCKGGIAVGLCVMEFLKNDVNFKRPIYFLLTSDEEISNNLSGQKGIDIITNNAQKSCAVFNLEPGKTNEVTVGRKGILRMSVEVCGVAAHAGNAYFDGASAIKEAANMVLEIEKMSQKDGVTFNCGVISGGTAPNIVPDRCVVEIDIRASKYEEMKHAENMIYELAKKIAIPNTKRNAEIVNIRPPMKTTDDNIRLLNLWNECAQTLGIEMFEGIKRGGGSDAAYTVLAGVPTLCSCGMVGYNEHTINEKVDLSTFDERVALIYNTIKKI